MSYSADLDYSGSFKGIGFWQLNSGDNGDAARPTNEYQTTTIHHPAGNDTTIINWGRVQGVLEFPVLVTSDDLDALIDEEQESSGTLIYQGGTITVRLDVVRGAVKHADFDAYTATLRFIKS